jgi:hypothetical protein
MGDWNKIMISGVQRAPRRSLIIPGLLNVASDFQFLLLTSANEVGLRSQSLRVMGE